MYEKELIAFSKAGARYLVIGGIALAFHDFPRSTFDLDIMPDLNSENLGIISETCLSMGYSPRIRVPIEDLKNPMKREYWIKEKNMRAFTFINLKESMNSIDLMIYYPLDFEECFKRRVSVNMSGVEVYVAGIEDLAALKRISTRPQDIIDTAALESILPGKKK